MSRTQSWTFLLTAALLGLVLGPGPAGRAEQGTVCTFTHPVTAKPGLSMTPGSGTFHSNGETGTIECDGPIQGQEPTGPGTLGIVGEYGTEDGDTCAGGEGRATHIFTIPTEKGSVHVEDPLTFTFGYKGGGPLGAKFHGKSFSGEVGLTPKKGDCITEPLTEWVAKGRGIFHG